MAFPALLIPALAQPVQAQTFYLFAGDKTADATRPSSIHRYALDERNPSTLTPAPSPGLGADYWGNAEGKPYKGMRITDMTVAPNGDVYAVCRETKNVLRFDGKTGASKGEVLGGLDSPDNIIVGPDGNLYISSNTQVMRCRPDGTPLPGAEQIGAAFTTGGNLMSASGMTFGPDGNLYVASQGTSQILRYDSHTGKFIGSFHAGDIAAPSEMVFGPDGNLYVASTAGPAFNPQSGFIAKINGKSGQFISQFAPEAKGAAGLVFGPDGNLWVSDYWTGKITRYDGKTGKSLGVVTSSPPGSAFFYLALGRQDKPDATVKPWAIAVPRNATPPVQNLLTANGPETVKGWQSALVPKGKPGPMLSLAAAKQAAYTLVLPAQPTTMDQKAAAALAWWLKEMTGATFSVVREGQSRKAGSKVISIGYTDLLKKSGLPSAKLDLGAEGYAIDAKDNTLFLFGGKTRGAIYAVYSLLEEDLNCRWYTFETTGSRIPRRATLTFRPTLRHFVPRLDVRDPYYADAFDGDWSLKNKTNGYNSPVPAAEGGYAKHALFVHTYNTLVPPAQYFESHPEYFAEVNGKRQPTQLELTNPDVLRITIENVKKHLRENPDAKFISVSPNDGRGYSESAESRAIDEAEATAPDSKSGTLIKFVNAVAEAIELEFPDVKLSTLAYLDTFMPPKTLRPRKNVIIQLCTDSHAWKYQYCFIDESPTFQKALKAWHAIGADMYIWDYTTDFVHYMVPMPNMPVVKHNINFYIQHGAKGVMLQGTYGSLGGENSPMRSWVWAKQLWDPTLDTRALMKDFIYGYYGTAAEPIWQYNQMLWQLWEENHKKPHTPGVTPVGSNPLLNDAPASQPPDWSLLDKTYIDTTSRLFARAESLAKDPETLHRVETAKLSLLYIQLGQGLGYITEFLDFKAGTWLKNRDEAGRAHYLRLLNEFERISKQTGVTTISEKSVVGDITTKWRTLLTQKASDLPVMPLNVKWSFKTDPQDAGIAQGWANAPTDASWAEVYSNKSTGWESQGFPDYKGLTWYRQSVKLPPTFQPRKKMYLYFGAVDSESQIYVNGTKVFDHTIASTGLPIETIWNAPFAVDVSPYFKAGQENTIAVRVTSAGGVRGVWKPAFLVSSDEEMMVSALKDTVVPFS